MPLRGRGVGADILRARGPNPGGGPLPLGPLRPADRLRGREPCRGPLHPRRCGRASAAESAGGGACRGPVAAHRGKASAGARSTCGGGPWPQSGWWGTYGRGGGRQRCAHGERVACCGVRSERREGRGAGVAHGGRSACGRRGRGRRGLGARHRPLLGRPRPGAPRIRTAAWALGAGDHRPRRLALAHARPGLSRARSVGGRASSRGAQFAARRAGSVSQ
mmetsp:Transcript_41380/g.117049  ORF Transcript_41380/g.117049 Transcript_41380/m.117049 type:complete len:220 (+) Transcript_41380:905-1564(+)